MTKTELAKLGESTEFKIKIRGDQGETHWLNISPDVFRQISELLRYGAAAPPSD